MDEPILRLLLVLAGILLVAVVAWLTRRLPRVKGVEVPAPDLPPGVHLFTAETCSTCEPARRVVRQAFGQFNEHPWESRADEFDRFGIGRVPVLIVIDEGGRALRWEGIPSPRDLKRGTN
jgi:hypothetical protein